MMSKPIKGRTIHHDETHLIIQNESGIVSTQILPSPSSSLPTGALAGALVEVDHGIPRVLTPNQTPNKSAHWMKRILDPRRKRNMKVRHQVESGIREFFLSHQFQETRTPLLVPCPGMEPHIRPFSIGNTSAPQRVQFLPTSPEFAMKRLLVGGLERIFQICPAFRDEPPSTTHRPEFTLLEWYRAYAGYEEIMKDTEELFEFLAVRFFGKPVLKFQNQEISVQTPWPRLRVRDLFLETVGVDLVRCNTREALASECDRLQISTQAEDTWDDLYFRVWLNLIEPTLPQNQAVFVTRYPASQAALSVIDSDPDGSLWARRFEVYAGGIELGNAFEELTDPVEQRRRFENDMKLREQIYGPSFPKSPLDEGFLEALAEGMPPSGGIAMGVDRMVMLFADEFDIDFTVWM